MTTTWNPSDIVGSPSFANGNLTVNISTGGGTRSTTSRAAGKYYFENTVGTAHSWQGSGFGFSPASDVPLSPTHTVSLGANGNISVNNTVVTGVGLPTMFGGSSIVIGVAVDLNSQLVWFKEISPTPSTWNGVAGASPGGTGGVSFTSVGTSSYFVYCFANAAITDMIGNFGASAFTGAVPTGFVAWDTSLMQVTQAAAEVFASMIPPQMRMTQSAIEVWGPPVTVQNRVSTLYNESLTAGSQPASRVSALYNEVIAAQIQLPANRVSTLYDEIISAGGIPPVNRISTLYNEIIHDTNYSTGMQLTQVATENWLLPSPSMLPRMLLTQSAIEVWASVVPPAGANQQGHILA
jgi:hypothetical protein